MSRCVDNPATKRIGCGAEFRGRDQHAVARCDWSEHLDGRAHCTFASGRASDLCWKGDEFRNPATLVNGKGELLLELDERGRWSRRSPAEGYREGQNSDETVVVTQQAPNADRYERIAQSSGVKLACTRCPWYVLVMFDEDDRDAAERAWAGISNLEADHDRQHEAG